MAGASALEDDFEADRGAGEPAFKVDLDGFEGPLDLLLELARRQKVDLVRISILELANQYLAFVEAARELRLELAADYLVMAAWLAHLKSRLPLPLRRLEKIRRAAELLISRPRIGRDVFARGAPEPIASAATKITFEATLYDLLSAYARQTQKRARAHVRFQKREVWSLAEAREMLTRLLGQTVEWTDLESWLIAWGVEPKMRRTARASSFSASLELVREGLMEFRQERAFAPLYMRSLAVSARGAPGAGAEGGECEKQQ